MRLEKFYDEYHTLLEKRAARLNKKPLKHPDVQDFLGDFWHKMVTKWETFPNVNKPLNWAYIIMLNLVRDKYRSQQSRNKYMIEIPFSEVYTSVDKDFTAEIDAKEILCLMKEILPAELRDMIYYTLSGMTQEEIGQILDKDQSYISRKLKEAREILQLDSF